MPEKARYACDRRHSFRLKTIHLTPEESARFAAGKLIETIQMDQF
jgi:hypothetical protein